MTLREIQTLLAEIDPDIRHYFSASQDRDYTYWEETKRLPILSDDRHEEAWRFYVHRFTRDQYDPVTARIFARLDADERIAFSHEIDVTDDHWLHHIFACEAV